MSDFKETCIWMSYRYAIGRKTIAAHCHAEDIFNHLDWVPEDRREFTARDITSEINFSMRFRNNLQMDSHGTDEVDVFSVLFEWMYEHPECCTVDYWVSHNWFVDCKQMKVFITEIPIDEQITIPYNSIFHEFGDYENWIKLAKILRNETVKVTVDHDGVEKILDCYEWWSVSFINGEIILRKHYSEKDGRWPVWFLSEDTIVKVER